MAQSWPRKSEQSAKWSFCLTAGKIDPRIRRDNEQTSPPDAHTGIEGKGGTGGDQGRDDAGPAGGAFRRPPEPDHAVEGAASGIGGQCVRSRRQRNEPTCRGREGTARQDRRTDVGERFFRRSAQQSRAVERKAMIDRAHDLPISKQAKALNISRGSVYYLPRPVSAADLALMRRIDELHLEFPFAGSRMLRGLLAAEGSKVGRRHVKTLMQRMGIEALYRRPRTTKPEPGHKIYPYLLRGVEITRANQVWAMDITYIPMARGFVYLAVVLDWFSRRVLSWRVSISMDGKGAWRDNVFVERLWRSVKYEEVYLRAYDSVSEARASIRRYFDFYNRRRPHSSLDGTTPDHAYFSLLPLRMAA